MKKITFPRWPSFTEEEAQAISRTLMSNNVNYWTGTECREFEKEYAEWVGCNYAIALANGTLALELALRALRIGNGDEVIVTSRTFIASASCIIALGAIPVFADVDYFTQNITVNTISKVMSPRTKAVICVHFAGMPCDMDPIIELTDAHGIFVIEDCAQAHGARYKGKSVGTIGHIGAWSFCQDKIITTGGEGGMVTTNDRDLWLKMWSYKDHGKSWNTINEHKNSSMFRWVHESFGSNYRMTELQSVIGRIQLRHIREWSDKRRYNAYKIWNTASEIYGLRAQEQPEWAEHACYKCYIFVNRKSLKSSWSRDRLITEINDQGVPCYSGSCSEIYLEKAFDGTGFRPSKRLPVARELGETSIMFLVHPTIENDHIEMTCAILKEKMKMAVTKVMPIRNRKNLAPI
jgi:dTDP-4-amino-4,6-dideoxygalactose transaminase